MSRRTINRRAELAALTACGTKVLASTNGHGVRWARAGCTAALMTAGHDATGAEVLSTSMARFSIWLAGRASDLQAEFARGATA